MLAIYKRLFWGAHASSAKMLLLVSKNTVLKVHELTFIGQSKRDGKNGGANANPVALASFLIMSACVNRKEN